MARNKSKYFYIELAIVRGSPLFRALLEDAATSGKPAALVAVQRLADYYRASDRPGATRPTPTMPAFQAELLPASPPDISPPMLSHKEPPAPGLAEDDAGEWEYRAEQARANALAALHALETWE